MSTGISSTRALGLALRVAACVASMGLLASCALVTSLIDPGAPAPRSDHERRDGRQMDVQDARKGDAVVRVFMTGGSTCSGVLIEPNIALTARHCFHTDMPQAATRVPTEIALGGESISWGWIGVKRTLPCTSTDVAVLVLAERVPGVVEPMRLRMNGP